MEELWAFFSLRLRLTLRHTGTLPGVPSAPSPELADHLEEPDDCKHSDDNITTNWLTTTSLTTHLLCAWRPEVTTTPTLLKLWGLESGELSLLELSFPAGSESPEEKWRTKNPFFFNVGLLLPILENVLDRTLGRGGVNVPDVLAGWSIFEPRIAMWSASSSSE